MKLDREITYDPGVLQRHHMVDADIGGVLVLGAVEERGPGAGGRVAVVADLDTIAVAAQHELARVAVGLALNRTPVREQVPVVAPVVHGRRNLQVRKKPFRLALVGDAGLRSVLVIWSHIST